MDAKEQARHDRQLATKQGYIDEIQRVRAQLKAGKVSAAYATAVETELAGKIIRLNHSLGIK
ncbi:MAG TPA: hypothetical protein VF928_08015 [Usitatibacteraceae bacterium]